MIEQTSSGGSAQFDRSYEWKAVLLLALAFGLVGLDRWILTPLFPAMMADLKLSYSDLGNIVGALAIAWGVSAIVIGRLSDRVGRRKVLIPALIGFSLMSGLTAMVGGLGALLAVRSLMGLAEGAFCPASVTAAGEASLPRRRGFNQGVQMSLFALLGFGFAPIIATQLLQVLPSWRQVFMVVAVPGLILAFLITRVIREPAHLGGEAASSDVPRPSTEPWSGVLAAHNVRIATFGLLCAMSCIFVMGAMVPNYLVDHLKLVPTTMGFVMSAMGWGGFVGEFAVPGLSDRIGRRWAAVIAFAGAILGTWFFARTAANPLSLFMWLAVMSFFGIGLLSLLTGPVAVEAVPPGLAASAVGFVSGTGEIFGGGVAPIIAGYVADGYGIASVFWVPIVGLSLGGVAMLFMRETAPRRLADNLGQRYAGQVLVRRRVHYWKDKG
jgi:MFS family permease